MSVAWAGNPTPACPSCSLPTVQVKPTRISLVVDAKASSTGPRRSKRTAAQAAVAAGAAAPPAAPPAQQQDVPAPAAGAPPPEVQPRTAGVKRKQPEPCTDSPSGELGAEAMMLSRQRFLGLALLAMGAVRVRWGLEGQKSVA